MTKKGGKPPPVVGGAKDKPAEPTVLFDGDPEFVTQTEGDREAAPYSHDGRFMKLEVIDVAKTPMQAAHEEIEAILKERSKNIVSAFVSNVSRKSWSQRWIDRVAAAGTAGTGLLMGEPIVFAAGVLVAVARDVVDVVRIRWADRPGASTKDKTVAEARQVMLLLASRAVEANPEGSDAMFRIMPALPEFHNLWVRASWRLCHLIRCYNVRAVVINELLKDATMNAEDVRAAKRMAMMMLPEHTRLLRIKRTLMDYCLAKDPKAGDVRRRVSDFTSLQTFNGSLDALDLFGDRAQETKRGPTPIEWLSLPGCILIKAEVALRLKSDLQTIGYIQEVDVTDLDKRLAALDAKERARIRAEKAAAEARAESEAAGRTSETDDKTDPGPKSDDG